MLAFEGQLVMRAYQKTVACMNTSLRRVFFLHGVFARRFLEGRLAVDATERNKTFCRLDAVDRTGSLAVHWANIVNGPSGEHSGGQRQTEKEWSKERFHG